MENDTSSSSGRGGHSEDKKPEKSQNGEVDYKKVRQIYFLFRGQSYKTFYTLRQHKIKSLNCRFYLYGKCDCINAYPGIPVLTDVGMRCPLLKDFA